MNVALRRQRIPTGIDKPVCDFTGVKAILAIVGGGLRPEVACCSVVHCITGYQLTWWRIPPPE
jgi:hypothetical protein